MAPSHNRDVFINCAFDSQFVPIFQAIVFAVVRSGFQARCALETDDASENRFAKIQRIIEDCPFGIHDISRTETDGQPPLPRFNMPLELGLFLGAKRFGEGRQRRKQVLILDTEQYRYQKFISDIAGQDIKAHSGSAAQAIEIVTNWLRQHTKVSNIPGGSAVAQEFARFQADLPVVLNARSLTIGDMTFGDYVAIAAAWITEF